MKRMGAEVSLRRGVYLPSDEGRFLANFEDREIDKYKLRAEKIHFFPIFKFPQRLPSTRG